MAVYNEPVVAAAAADMSSPRAITATASIGSLSSDSPSWAVSAQLLTLGARGDATYVQGMHTTNVSCQSAESCNLST